MGEKGGLNMKKSLLILTLFFVPFIYSGCEVSQDSSNDYTAVVEDTASVIAASYSTASYDDLAVMEEAVDAVGPVRNGTCDGTCDHTCDQDCDCTCDQNCDQDCDCTCDQTGDQDCSCTCDQNCDQDCDCTCDQNCDSLCLLEPYVAHHRVMNGYNRNGSADITFTVAYYDIDGEEQDTYDALTTEKVVWSDSFTSELITPVLVKSVTRTHQFDITGLVGENETITINGTGTADKTATRTHPLDKFIHSYHMTLSKAYGDVIWSTDRETYPYPLSGTIHLVINVEKTATTDDKEVEKTFSLDAMITFNGTCYPVLVIDKEKTFIINMTDGTAAEE